MIDKILFLDPYLPSFFSIVCNFLKLKVSFGTWNVSSINGADYRFPTYTFISQETLMLS